MGRWQIISALLLLLWVWTASVGKEPIKKPPPFPLSLFAQASPEAYIGDRECAACHKEPTQTFNASPHALWVRDPKLPVDKRGCEACHGPGEVHLENVKDRRKVIDFDQLKPREVSMVCLRCHADTMRLSQWHRTAHAQADIACTDCHYVHKREDEAKNDARLQNTKFPTSPLFITAPEPKSLLKASEVVLCGNCHQRSLNEFRLNSHHPLPEGRIVCSDCHDVHPAKTSNKRTQAIKEMCVNCHGDKLGPFAFEHDPVAGWTGDGCTECHRPHGSHNPRLLRAFSRGLCNQCHTDKGNNHYPGRTCWSVGCHVAVHGSNTDIWLRQP